MITDLDFLMLMKNNAVSMNKTIRKLEEGIAEIGRNALKELHKIILLMIEPDEEGIYSVTIGYNEFYYAKAELIENGELINIKEVCYKEFEGLYVVTDTDKTYKVTDIIPNDIPNLLEQTLNKIWIIKK